VLLKKWQLGRVGHRDLELPVERAAGLAAFKRGTDAGDEVRKCLKREAVGLPLARRRPDLAQPLLVEWWAKNVDPGADGGDLGRSIRGQAVARLRTRLRALASASAVEAPLVSVRRLLESFESLGFDGAHLDSRRGLQCGRTRTGRSTTAIT